MIGALLALLGGCSAPEAPPGALLFVSERGGAPATFQVAADGSGVRRLEGPPGAVYPGDPDPRRTHALLVSAEELPDQTHREQLWLVPLDGGAARTLTPPAGRIRNPSWGPDGAWVVFESDAMSYRDLFRVARDGTGLTRLTDAEHGSFEPDVSADGARIAFGTSRDGNAEVYTMAADGSDVRRLTDHPADDIAPRWSPDGQQLSWISRREGRARVWVTDGRGADRPLRPNPAEAEDLDHAWSPDGKRLAVTVTTGPKAVSIEVIDVTTGAVVVGLDGEGPDEHPAWSPDGRWLAFSSSRSGSPAIWLATVDGAAARRLTDGGTDWLPRWVP